MVITGLSGSGKSSLAFDTIYAEAGTGNDTIVGNYIGTDVSGTIAIGNSVAGIQISQGSESNIIGGEGAKGNLISHDIVADAGQFVAQRFGRKACIGLNNLAVIISSELLIMSAA